MQAAENNNSDGSTHHMIDLVHADETRGEFELRADGWERQSSTERTAKKCACQVQE